MNLFRKISSQVHTRAHFHIHDVRVLFILNLLECAFIINEFPAYEIMRLRFLIVRKCRKILAIFLHIRHFTDSHIVDYQQIRSRIIHHM